MAITSNCAEIIITNPQGSVAFNKLITTTELSPAKTIYSEDRVYLIQDSENVPLTFWWNLEKAIADGYADLQELYDYFVDELANQCGGGGGGIESVTGPTVDNTDPLNPVVNIIFNVTFDGLQTLITGSDLIVGAEYVFPFVTTYDQSISDVTKTGASETIVATAISSNKLSPIVQSLDFPKDIIHYDATVLTTYVNNAPCQGKITYREDEKGNKAPFDFRKILMFNSNDSSESLFFDLANTVTENGISSSEEYMNQFGLEFPASFITGDSTQNSNNVFGNSYIDGNLKQSTNNSFFGSKFKNITQAANNVFSGNDFKGDITQMINMDVTNCVLENESNYCTSSSWGNTQFGEKVNKSLLTNFSFAEVGGRIDRLVNCVVLGAEGIPTTISGRLFWSQNLFIDDNVQIAGSVQGVNNLSIVSTTANCHIEKITGVTMFDASYGFLGCTIIGTNGASVFGAMRVDCLVSGKIIDQTTYTELFDVSFVKTVYAKPNGTVWYTWLDDSNVAQFKEIV